jgi:hypothetical protein
MKAFSQNDVQTAQSFLTQLVDVIQEDMSGSVTRRKYQVYVTGGIGPGVTSSLFQTVYDQDFTLQTANSVLDMTVGLFQFGSSVTNITSSTDASTGFINAPRTALMMREKVDVYRSFAKTLLGDASKAFYAPYADNTSAFARQNDKTGNSTGKSGVENLGAAGIKTRIDEALFLGFKRLFARDGIKKETFAFKFFTSASNAPIPGATAGGLPCHPNLVNNFPASGSVIFTDAGSSNTDLRSAGGSVGEIVNSNNSSEKVGLMFYDRGVAVLDLRKIMSGTQHVSGVISAVTSSTPVDTSIGNGKVVIGAGWPDGSSPDIGDDPYVNPNAQFIPDLVTSASIDDIVDHIASCRFGSGSLTGITFQNLTNINSTLYFARATADEFNYSSNPTYLDSDGNIRVIDASARADGTQKAFSFVTKVGLHDAQGNLLAVAKLSRPVEKNSEKDITFRVRLDF